MFDLLEENEPGGAPYYNWLVVQVTIAGFATLVGQNFPELTHHGVFVGTSDPQSMSRSAEANRQMCVLCFALQNELSRENCADYDTVVASLEEEIRHYRQAMQHAVFRYLVTKLNGGRDDGP